MNKALINALKIIVPLGIGVWLVYKQYHDLGPDDRTRLFSALGEADLAWLGLATIVGWLAHVSRSWRWRYLLEPLGHRPGFWSCYHAVMIGYFINMFIPRAGEASRAVSLYRTEGVTFERGFGTIMAERVVDMIVLLLFALVAIGMQMDMLDHFRARIEDYNDAHAVNAAPPDVTYFNWWWIGGIVLVLIVAFATYLIFKRPALRARFMDLIRGFMDGLKTVLHTRKKGLFMLHTVFIWMAYLGMFQVGFYCLPAMTATPFPAILAGFIAGAIGIILVPGGIGAYPALVAMTVGVYLPSSAAPDALAMGWLLWAAQTLMIIVLGGVSLLLTAMQRRRIT